METGPGEQTVTGMTRPEVTSSQVVSSRPGGSARSGADEKPVRRRKRPSTSHLKSVPETLSLRDRIKTQAERYTSELDKSQPFTSGELEAHGRQLLEKMDLPEKYLGFTMVLIGNFFWKRQFLATPFERRLLLLPHCLKHAEGCPAEYDEFGLDCERCGACSIADYKARAEELGYRVLVAEGSPIVLKIIVAGYVDAILGVACLNVLEKAIDKVLIAGVPSYAIPLHSGDCRNTSLDESWVWEVLDRYETPVGRSTSSYLPLMRAANRLFDDEFDRLLPRAWTKQQGADGTPLGATEHIAYDWLSNGGKRFRPFITLAAWNAVRDTDEIVEADETVQIPDAVGRVAMAIEAFHKASLVHDDIQDDDAYRYGRETLHRTHGLGPAINIGDYLIGLGYRLVNSARADLGSDVAADIIDRMASAHIKLCDGQGAEMAWQSSPDWRIKPIDALQIYALKTAPAFEAALYSGLRMAGPLDDLEQVIPLFSRHLGVGFQILNDLKDWNGDADNKLVSGQDALARRPTVLLALALESASDRQQTELQDILTGQAPTELRVSGLRRVFRDCGVFDRATALVDRSRERAEAIADDVACEGLRRLMYFFVDTVLAAEHDAPNPDPSVLVPLTLETVES